MKKSWDGLKVGCIGIDDRQSNRGTGAIISGFGYSNIQSKSMPSIPESWPQSAESALRNAALGGFSDRILDASTRASEIPG